MVLIIVLLEFLIFCTSTWLPISLSHWSSKWFIFWLLNSFAPFFSKNAIDFFKLLNFLSIISFGRFLDIEFIMSLYIFFTFCCCSSTSSFSIYFSPKPVMDKLPSFFSFVISFILFTLVFFFEQQSFLFMPYS